MNRTDPQGMNPVPCTNPAETCFDPLLLCEQVYGVPCYFSEPGHIPLPLRPSLPPHPSISAAPIPPDMCRSSDWFEAPGYAEGSVGSFSGNFAVEGVLGMENVYDFATMERAIFKFEGEPLFEAVGYQSKPGVTTAIIEGAYMEYGMNLTGFHSIKNIDGQYSGRFVGMTFGIGGGIGPITLGGKGGIIAMSPEINGVGKYEVISPGWSPIPVVSGSIAATDYKILPETSAIPNMKVIR